MSRRGRQPRVEGVARCQQSRSCDRKRAARRLLPSGGRSRPRALFAALPRELEQRHLDLIGLGLLAAALYLGFVLYAGWNGGLGGSGLEVALTWAGGSVSYAVPMVLAGCGIALVVKPLIRYPGTINAGAILLVAGLLLAFAAGTAGLGPDEPARSGTFDPDFMTSHGGVLGEALYWASATLFQRVGAHIIAVLMVLSGILLLSGRRSSACSAPAPKPPGGPGMRAASSPARSVAAATASASGSATAGRPRTIRITTTPATTP